ncbi:DsrE family protein [Desulforamulus ruminis]|uniref:Uncharacterized protein n=1 Tax=Desulforamulus ruminis (strain ATCC 23193 / DSM 2154 / NCIMB 8452 / DL) TaxID=696281 RepID=F6DS77_DESRL|nr:DsrE family protein [Desulforamulus ruminis]AEG58839.1 hypothetical protein Desru_0553 [Desulforamulus ruminis DSM 2154]
MSDSLAQRDKLVILWTNGDKEVADKMVFMYALNAKKKGWWQDICLMVWGPSARLLSTDAELQASLAGILETGVEVVACKECADRYGISNKLEQVGIEVKYTGLLLTQFLKEGYKVITI